MPSVAPDARDAEDAGSETEDAHAVTVGSVVVRERGSRSSVVPRSRPRPGTSFGHDVLLALIMAVAMAATVFLYR